MSTTSNHGGARPGAGRKPKHNVAPATDLLSVLSADPAALAQVQQRLTEALPQLLDALISLAQGATTTHERWVAAGTLNTGIGNHTCMLLPQLPPAQLVLVGCDTYTHKPDTKALLFLLEHLLAQNPAALTTLPPLASSASPTEAPAEPTQENAEHITAPTEVPQPSNDNALALEQCGTLAECDEPLTVSLQLHPNPPLARSFAHDDTQPQNAPRTSQQAHDTKRPFKPDTSPNTASALSVPASRMMWWMSPTTDEHTPKPRRRKP